MIYIDKQSNNPWFNLAAEEFVLKNLTEDVFMLWQNTESIVFGKHQLPQQEFDIQFIELENVPLIRRISGGGTVYHGQGNVNFSFVTTEVADKINFQKFLHPIQLYLRELGINAEITSKSNLTIDGLKISGNAASVHRNRSLHHGTLLFDSDKKRLEFLLTPPKNDYHSKAVVSNRVKTTNISNYLKSPIDFDEFCKRLKYSVMNYFDISEIRNFNPNELEQIAKLVDEKYQTWQWNQGYSPEYSIERKVNLFGEEKNISLRIKHGRVDSVILNNDFTTEFKLLFSEIVMGSRHTKSEITKALKPLEDDLSEKEFNNLINSLL